MNGQMLFLIWSNTHKRIMRGVAPDRHTIMKVIEKFERILD